MERRDQGRLDLSERRDPGPAAVAADDRARSALAALGEHLRRVGYDTTESPDPICRAARGELVPRAALVDALGADAVASLTRSGMLEAVAEPVGGDETVRLTATVLPMRSVLTLLPEHLENQDVVYLGRDSILLFDLVWRRGGIGRLAADLATGNGFIAAALATRFDHVVAADLSWRCVASAGLVAPLNRHLAGRYSVAQLDVAAGLRRGMFDLVSANAPWVPETAAPDGTPPRRFAAGGVTGYELPRRFVEEAIELLAPRGRAFVACMDITFGDGSRPVLDHVAEIAGRPGLDVEVVPTGLATPAQLEPWARERHPDALSARHVVVVIRRTT